MREKDIYEAMNQGVLLCDEKSRILYFNSSYSRFIGYRLEEICGKPIRDIRPGAVVPDVIANGKPQESLFRVENDQEYFADIYPVMEDGQVVGSVSVVTSMMNANCIKDKMLKLEEQEKVMKDRLSRTNGTHSVCVLSIQKIILQVLPHRKQPLLSWTMPKVSLDVIMTFVPMPKLIWHMQNFLSALATICLYLIFFLSLTMVVLKQPNGLSCFLVNGTFRYL